MPTIKLSDIQLVLLITAAQREDGSILPFPNSLGDQETRIRRAILPLTKKTLVEEIIVSEASRVWRDEGGTRIGLAITAAGRAMIAVEDELPASPVVQAAAPEAPVAPPPSKIATIVTMLRHEGGATLAEMVATTSWLPHTTRAALTRLRKKGHAIAKADRDGATAYSIEAAA